MNVTGDYFFPDRKDTDMYLPNQVLALSIFCLLCTAAAVVACFFFSGWIAVLLVVGVAFLVVSVMAFLCWKNQMLVMHSDEIFYYRTYMGNVYRLHFKDVQRVKHNADSVQLILPERKVHIESMAVLSDQFQMKLLALETGK